MYKNISTPLISWCLSVSGRAKFSTTLDDSAPWHWNRRSSTRVADQSLIRTRNFIIHSLNPEVLFCYWIIQCTAYFWFDSIQRTFGLTFRFLESIYYSRPYKYKLMWSPVEKTHKIMSPLNNTKGISEHKYKDVLVLCFLFYDNNLVFLRPSSQTWLVWYWKRRIIYFQNGWQPALGILSESKSAAARKLTFRERINYRTLKYLY